MTMSNLCRVHVVTNTSTKVGVTLSLSSRVPTREGSASRQSSPVSRARWPLSFDRTWQPVPVAPAESLHLPSFLSLRRVTDIRVSGTVKCHPGSCCETSRSSTSKSTSVSIDASTVVIAAKRRETLRNEPLEGENNSRRRAL